MTLVTYNEDSQNYNTYANLADIDTFKEYYPLNFKNLDELSDNEKEMYLKLASSRLDSEYNFKYNKINREQNLEHPRGGLNFVHQDIVFITILTAINLINDVINHDNDVMQGNIKSEKVGRTLNIEYKAFNDMDIVKINQKGRIDKYIDYLITPYIITGVYLCRG